MEDIRANLLPENKVLALLVLSALILSAALSPTINLLLGMGGEANGEGSLTRIIIYSLIFALALKTTIKKFDSKTWWPLPASMTLCILWFFISLTWAINPAVGFRRLALTLVIIWTTFALVNSLQTKATFNLIRLIFGLILLLNYIAVYVFPGIGLTDDTYAWLAGAWHGILAEKNHAGAVSALTFLLFTFDAAHIKRHIRFFVAITSGYFLYKTTSKTSLGLTALATVLGYVFLYYKPYYRILALAFLSAIALVIFVVIGTFGDTIFEFFEIYMSDPASLTGRVQIWPVLWSYFESNWVLGAGFGSFWNIGAESPIFAGEGWVTEIASGHNGYLDILVQIGLPGLMIVVFAAFILPASKIIWFKQSDPQRTALIVSILFFCFAHNLTETTLFDRDSIVFIFILLAIAAIGRESEKQPDSK
jgi:O-antigen ligase